MSEKISRRGFLQTIGAAAATAVTAGAVGAYCGGKMAAAGPAAPSGAAAVYTPGTYTGTAAGMGAGVRKMASTKASASNACRSSMPSPTPI